MAYTPSVGIPTVNSEVRALAPEVSEFLAELAAAHAKLATYPASHPMIKGVATAVHTRLLEALVDSPTLTASVTRDSFLVDGAESSNRNKLIAALARRLHDEQIGAIIFQEGIEPVEIDEFLQTLARGSALDDTPLGLGLPGELNWPHARMVPLAYEKLRLSSAEFEAGVQLFGGSTEIRALWLQLAHTAAGVDGTATPRRGAAVVGEGGAEDGGSADADLPTPEEVASSLSGALEGAGGGAGGDSPAAERARSVAGTLGQLMAAASRGGGEGGAASLRDYLSVLIRTLDQATLARLVVLQGDHAASSRFLLAASEGLVTDALVTLARAAAAAGRVAISSPMLRIMSRLASKSLPGSEGDLSVRAMIKGAVESWEARDAAPLDHATLLEDLAADGPDPTTLRGNAAVDQFSLMATALETGCITRSARIAADRLMIAGEVDRVLDAIALEKEYNAESALELKQKVLRPALLQMLLRSNHVEFGGIERFARESGINAADPLLDVLATTEERALRARLVGLLAQMGLQLGPIVSARLPGSPWYVQRNLLDLIGRLPEFPEDGNVLECARHPDARVRRAAFRVIFRFPAHRDGALLMALGDSDDDVLRMALGAALESVTANALAVIRRRYLNSLMPDDIRAMCIKILTRDGDGMALDDLLPLVIAPKRFMRKDRLHPKGPTMLAALTAIATYYRSNHQARPALDLAAASTDAEIRQALSTAQAMRARTPL